jgi:hypothetical protein
MLAFIEIFSLYNLVTSYLTRILSNIISLFLIFDFLILIF